MQWDSIPALVQDAGARYGDRLAVVDGLHHVTYEHLALQVRVAAAAAIAHGIEPGDRAAIWAPNSSDWIVAALGLVSAGAALVPLNTRFKAAEVGYILERSSARLLVVSGEFLGTDYAAMLHAEYPTGPGVVERIVTFGDEWADFLDDATSVLDDDVSLRLAEIQGADISDVIFTSGTTGRPKGVVTTHAQTLRVFDTWSDVVGLEEGDRYLVINPFFHTFGYKAGILACLMRGATIYPQAVFDVPEALETIERERITVLPGPPTLYQTILDAPDREKRDLSSLRLAVTGAAVVPVELVRRMGSELGFDTVLTAYGLTESTGTVSMCRRDDDAETIATTSGRAIPDTELRVVDADGNDQPAGVPGEVVTRGYHVMQGYFEDPEATAQTIDADGWLHTGDIGVMDERGYLRVTDRIKDMYVVGGFNAYPAEIEQALAQHPAVAEAAVVGVPDERMGEVGRAFVVAKPGESIDPDEVIAWCRERMANYKVPRSVEAIDALPRNASGKVLKFQLRGTA